MSNLKISELSGVTNPSITGVTVVVVSGETYQTSLQSLRTVLVDSGSHFFTGSQTINGNLVISGSLTAQQYILSSSYTNMTIESISGSTAFGNTFDDTHNFTGSLRITGSLELNGASFSAATSGTSGTSGINGSSGTSGLAGSSGSSGTSGESGSAGSSGTSGTSGESGTSGTSGDSLFASTGSFWATTNDIQVTGSLVVSGGMVVSGSNTITGNQIIQGSLIMTGAMTVSASNFSIFGSGSATPLFAVNGSLGQIFTVYDELTGSLWSINDASGLPVFEANADSRIFIGNYQSPMLLTSVKTTLTAVNNNIVYQNIPTSAYSLVLYDYLISSASNFRAGELTAIWDGASVNLLDTTKINVGVTSGVTFSVTGSSGNLVLSASAATNGWITKVMIKAI